MSDAIGGLVIITVCAVIGFVGLCLGKTSVKTPKGSHTFVVQQSNQAVTRFDCPVDIKAGDEVKIITAKETK